MYHHRHALLAGALCVKLQVSSQRSGGRIAILTHIASCDVVWRFSSVLPPAGVVMWCEDLAFWCQLSSVERHVCKLTTRLGLPIDIEDEIVGFGWL